MLGVNANSQFNSRRIASAVAGTAEAIAQDLDPAAWQRLSAGDGTKDPRLYDWSYLELADLEADEHRRGSVGLWTRGLLIRRSIAGGAEAFFTTGRPAGTGIETLVAVEGRCRTIEDSFETAKNELGLDHNESRSWHGWHRHVSLVMLAFAMRATIRRHANQPTPQKTLRRLVRTRQTSSAGQSRKSAGLPTVWRNNAIKLHFVINQKGQIMALKITPGNTADSTVLDEMTRHLTGKLYADKGYIGHELFKTLWQRGLHLITGICRNMKNYLMPTADKIMLRKRFSSRPSSVSSNLKWASSIHDTDPS